MSSTAVDFSIDSGVSDAGKASRRRRQWSEIRVLAQEKQGKRLRATFKLRTTRSMTEPELSDWVFDTIRRDMGTDHLAARVHAVPRA